MFVAGKSIIFWSEKTSSCLSAPQPISLVTFGELPDFSEPQFVHLGNRKNECPHHWVGRLNEKIRIEALYKLLHAIFI